MTSFRNLVCAVSFLPLAAAAQAQSGDAVAREDLDAINRMGMEVGTYAADYLAGWGDMFEPQILVRMGFVAQQRAIAHTCEGFEVDEALYSDAMSSIMDPVIAMIEVPEDAEGAAINLPFTIAMSAYSMVLGGNIAAGAADPDAMCALGAEVRESLDGNADQTLRIWTAAN